MEERHFEKLYSIDVNDKVEKKAGLTYLSWAWAWAEAKKVYPRLFVKPLHDEKGNNYFTDGISCWVEVEGWLFGRNAENADYPDFHEELPIMDYKNRSIGASDITSFDVNKTIKRCITKALALEGLGLYIYAGEDLPEDPTSASSKTATKAKTTSSSSVAAPTPAPTSAPAADTAPKGFADTPVVTSENTMSLEELKSAIGKMVKKMFSTDGNNAVYNNVISEVTGSNTFKCNTATEDQIESVRAIYDALVKKGY